MILVLQIKRKLRELDEEKNKLKNKLYLIII